MNNLKIVPTKIAIEQSKFAWLIEKNDIDYMKQVIAKLYKVLGGVNYVLIPFNRDEIDKSSIILLETYKPDYIIYSDDNTKELAEEIGRKYNCIDVLSTNDSGTYSNEYLRFKSGDDNFDVSLDIESVKNFDNGFYNIFVKPLEIDGCIMNEVENTNFFNEIPDKIGDLRKYNSRRIAKGISYNGKFIDDIKKSIDDYEVFDLIDGLESLKESSTYFFDFKSNVIIIGDSTCNEDIANYWNTNVFSGKDVFWIPYKTSFPIIEDYLNQVLNRIAKDRNGKIIIDILSSRSSKKSLSTLVEYIYDTIKSIPQNLERVLIRVNPDKLLMASGIYYELKSYNENIIYHDDKAVITPMLETEYSMALNDDMNHFVATISSSDKMHPQISDVFNLCVPNNKGKITEKTLRIDINHGSIDLIKPKSIDVFKSILEKNGFTLKLSDKGLIANRVLTFLNGVENCDILMKAELLDYMNNLERGKDSYMVTEEIEKKFGKKLVERLLDKNIFFRGVLVKCKDCCKASWFSLNNLDETLICSGCKGSITLPIHIDISYSINELIKHAFTQGVITDILSIYNKYIESRYSSFYFVPGVEIKELNREIDFMLIDGDKFIIGESKNDSRQLKKTEADSILQVANQLGSESIIFTGYKNKFNKQLISAYKDEDVEFMNLYVKNQ